MLERHYSGKEEKVKKILPELFPELSYSEISACLRRRDVKVNGKRTSSDTLVSNGLFQIYPKVKKSVKILFEDENLLAVYKPKGISSDGEGSFSGLVREEIGENCVLMHRLDRNTDGILLFAKTEIAERELFSAMKEGRIEKKYSAEVYGRVLSSQPIELTYYYKKDEKNARAILSTRPKEGYVPVSISFIPIKRKEESTVLEVTLHKGKMHQIRAMLARYGFFIIGDGKYGNDAVNKALGVKKQLLTATSVSFDFPEKSALAYLNKIHISL